MEESKNIWADFTKKYSPGDIIEVIVKFHTNHGVFVDLGYKPIIGFIPVPELFDEPVHNYTEMYPPLNKKIRAKIKGFVVNDNQVYLSTKPSDLEN